MRVEYLRKDQGILTEEQETATRKQLPDYMEHHPGGNPTAHVVEESGRLAGTVSMMAMEKFTGSSTINGKTGTLTNAYACLEYRKLSLDVKLVTMVLEDVRQKELRHADLHVTVQGKKLHEYLGFQKSESYYIPTVFEL